MSICLKRIIMCFKKKHKKDVVGILDNYIGKLNYTIVEKNHGVIEVEFYENEITNFLMELKLYCSSIIYSEYQEIEEVGFNWKREED